jgi:hypothetical protein
VDYREGLVVAGRHAQDAVARLEWFYQWCRPTPVARVNLCVADNPNALVLLFTALKCVWVDLCAARIIGKIDTASHLTPPPQETNDWQLSE